MRRWMMVPMGLVLAGTGVAVGPVTASAAPAPAAVTGCPVGWGSLPEDRSAGGGEPLTGVRTGRHPCFDRMVLDVPGSSAAHPVGYHVHYVDRLVQDGSGRPVEIGGGAVLEIVAVAPAYDPETGSPTYPARAGAPLPGVDLRGYHTFRDARFASSFEGQTQVGLGVRARLPFRVFQLDGRLVIDVAHSWTSTVR
ncbi:AMIN-like domain-containing (lipo)protein [Kitasatospora camelliae]|uniref:AMIN-like domain-containing protein n=1 Tax=Kitasatospora camelliae TaxID=3156397 RepID=A0AAU8K4U6_9ACTN